MESGKKSDKPQLIAGDPRMPPEQIHSMHAPPREAGDLIRAVII